MCFTLHFACLSRRTLIRYWVLSRCQRTCQACASNSVCLRASSQLICFLLSSEKLDLRLRSKEPSFSVLRGTFTKGTSSFLRAYCNSSTQERWRKIFGRSLDSDPYIWANQHSRNHRTLVARHYDDFKEDPRLDWDAINNNPSQTLFVLSPSLRFTH